MLLANSLDVSHLTINLYCTTKYPNEGVSNAVDVLVGKIDYREFLHSRGTSFGQFHLTTSYKNARDHETFYTIYVDSLQDVYLVGYHDPDNREGIHIRISSGDTVAVAILHPPTVQTPHQGYIIANLTRPEVVFEIPTEIGDIDVLDLIP